MLQICSMWLPDPPRRGVKHSTPWSRQKGTFMAPKPQPLPRALLLYLALQFWTWVILLITLLSFNLILHGTAKLLPLSSHYQNIHNCFVDSFRILMLNSPPKLPRQVALRYLLTAWSFFSLLTTTVYSSGFTSLLTSPIYSDPIDTIQNLLNQNIYWGEQSRWLEGHIRNSKNTELQEFGNKFMLENSQADRERRILQGHYAVFCKVLSDSFVTESEKLSPEARQNLRVMEEPVFTFYVGIGMRENSPYTSYFDSTITRLEQGGLIDFWQQLIIYRLGYRYMNTFFTLQNDVIQRRPLSLNSVQGSFYLLATGWVITNIVFLFEIVIKYFKK
ncbi:hypothetical protein L9F63_005493 [Diploptera punctata]|uniref:Ionotropic glutamate receptor C-terminal domain-containing protein n=1 Tax=Diploptera punctata TaxID=6984 RepID=A0AAD7ZDD9_DIPPU|nr:hypothetical protein L9F63_005493 [Diploptera punctata]